jgi:hypothetical protein
MLSRDWCADRHLSVCFAALVMHVTGTHARRRASVFVQFLQLNHWPAVDEGHLPKCEQAEMYRSSAKQVQGQVVPLQVQRYIAKFAVCGQALFVCLVH